MIAPVCDHCGLPVRLEYRPNTEVVRWTHDFTFLGRWTCPVVSDGEAIAERTMATHNGVEWFDARVPVHTTYVALEVVS